MDQKYVDGIARALDGRYQDDLSLKQTTAYWDMLKTMATKGLEIKDDCTKKGQFDPSYYYEGLKLLSMDEIGIPNEALSKEMFEPILQGYVFTNVYTSMENVSGFRNKLWHYWAKHGLDELSILLNF